MPNTLTYESGLGFGQIFSLNFGRFSVRVVFTWPIILRIYRPCLRSQCQSVGGCVGPPMRFEQLFSCLAELTEQSLCTFVW